MKERDLQKYVRALLADPSKVWTTQSGRRLQILSPGRINPFEGPDYNDFGMLLDGMIVTGDAEFHRNSSEWGQHSHEANPMYKNVVLHIVFNDNSLFQAKFETLVVSEGDVLNVKPANRTSDEEVVKNAEELQHFALIRLLRKATEAQKLLNSYTLEESLLKLAADFILNYEKKRRRPIYDDNRLEGILFSLRESAIHKFLKELADGIEMNIPDKMLDIIKIKILNEGAAFRRELVLNAALPLALCLAEESSRINLFLWYWSTPALNKYGILSRFFPDLSQKFLWQQQGMLEYMRNHGKKSNVFAEALSDYGFDEILNFYRLGNPPFNNEK